LAALAVFLRACSSSYQAVRAPSPVTLYDTRHQVIARLAPDGTITDGAAKLVTRYDASSHSMTLVGTKLDVSQSIRQLGPSELQIQVGPLGPWRVRLSSNVVEVDGRPFGYVEGLDGSQAEMTRLGVLMCVVPVVNAIAPTSPGFDSDTEQPLPPPPPPKRDRF
jgi:hypothetical protein